MRSCRAGRRRHHFDQLPSSHKHAFDVIAAITLPLPLSGIIQAYGWRAGYLTLSILVLLPWPFD
jgi:hypothetical protein